MKCKKVQMICEYCGNLLEDCECDNSWKEEVCNDYPLLDDIHETSYDGDGF